MKTEFIVVPVCKLLLPCSAAVKLTQQAPHPPHPCDRVRLSSHGLGHFQRI
ncbi:hypothetical protein PR003_g23121 [Phytophthora rubi]|uniref:RxLR effector protein n=2 Tax=Phytophthora TaxID=4783 RepID=A0A6A4D9T5_9STRA|nr:hypothetical protein PR002_g25603 [Phytophthora rubi]KAE8976060.1 hypothetical protein PR001_g25527 [Phytophthora rubi]KAE9274986.1 hypothetical protein PF008_g29457 [Phytophthora fragariae]KAE9298937.1 hypothetical protein PR003_g23121 [Phytophthora rubi]